MTLNRETERKLAARLFNRVWALLEKPERTAEDEDELIHAAHASRYHWGVVDEPENAVRGEWQISRVYATLGRAEPALHHARRCVELAEAARDLEDWDVPFAYEALARAHAVAGDKAESARFAARARELADGVTEVEDRDLLLADLATIQGSG